MLSKVYGISIPPKNIPIPYLKLMKRPKMTPIFVQFSVDHKQYPQKSSFQKNVLFLNPHPQNIENQNFEPPKIDQV